MCKRAKNITDINVFRRKRKKQFLFENESRLSSFLCDFISKNIQIDFCTVSDAYLAQQINENADSWDYDDLRERIGKAIQTAYGNQVWSELSSQHWFQSQYLTLDEVIEKMIREFILSDTALASQLQF